MGRRREVIIGNWGYEVDSIPKSARVQALPEETQLALDIAVARFIYCYAATRGPGRGRRWRIWDRLRGAYVSRITFLYCGALGAAGARYGAARFIGLWRQDPRHKVCTNAPAVAPPPGAVLATARAATPSVTRIVP